MSSPKSFRYLQGQADDGLARNDVVYFRFQETPAHPGEAGQSESVPANFS